MNSPRRLDTAAVDVGWSGEGRFSVTDFLAPALLDTLRAEAAVLRTDAPRRGVRGMEIRRDGSFATASNYAAHRGGPALTALLRDPRLLRRLRTATGLDRLIPVRSSYNYYSPGDYMGLHRDEVRASATVTFALTPRMPSTRYLDDARGWSAEELTSFVTENGSLPLHGAEMELLDGVMNVFDGYNIPHWRPVVEEDCILANLVFFRL